MDKQRRVISALKNYKAQVYDVDGTLVDLGIDWNLVKQKLSEHSFEQKRDAIVFTPLMPTLLKVKEKYGVDFYHELVDIIASFETNDDTYRVNKPLISYINSACDKNIALYSMNTNKCIHHIVTSFFRRKPDCIISGESCIEPKPTEKDLFALQEFFNVEKKDMVFIGNSTDDLLSGKKAGIRTMMITI